MTRSENQAPEPARAGTVAVAAWSLVLFAGCRAIEIVLEAQSMAAAVGQAVLVEWGAGRLGVGWSAPAREPMTAARIARRAGVGAAIGLGLAGTLLAVLGVTRAIAFEPVPHVEPSVLAVGLLTAGLHAWRDELLLHGLVLRALDGSAGSLAKVLACGATSAGAALGRVDASARTVFVAAVLGVVFGALWVRDRGAWQPWAAHTGLRFATGTLFAGGVVYGRLAGNAWAGGSDGMLGGTAAAVALAPCAVLALVLTARGISPREAPVG